MIDRVRGNFRTRPRAAKIVRFCLFLSFDDVHDIGGMSTTEVTLQHFAEFLAYALAAAENAFFKIPGSQVVARYVKSSHRNDPGRTVLELILVIFAIRTLLQSRTRADNSGKNFVKYTEQVSFFFQLVSPECWLTQHRLGN